jgi:hypothetical protein
MTRQRAMRGMIIISRNDAPSTPAHGMHPQVATDPDYKHRERRVIVRRGTAEEQ